MQVQRAVVGVVGVDALCLAKTLVIEDVIFPAVVFEVGAGIHHVVERHENHQFVAVGGAQTGIIAQRHQQEVGDERLCVRVAGELGSVTLEVVVGLPIAHAIFADVVFDGLQNALGQVGVAQVVPCARQGVAVGAAERAHFHLWQPQVQTVKLDVHHRHSRLHRLRSRCWGRSGCWLRLRLRFGLGLRSRLGFGLRSRFGLRLRLWLGDVGLWLRLGRLTLYVRYVLRLWNRVGLGAAKHVIFLPHPVEEAGVARKHRLAEAFVVIENRLAEAVEIAVHVLGIRSHCCHCSKQHYGESFFHNRENYQKL